MGEHRDPRPVHDLVGEHVDQHDRGDHRAEKVQHRLGPSRIRRAAPGPAEAPADTASPARSRCQRRTMPNWLSVKLVNTPMM